MTISLTISTLATDGSLIDGADVTTVDNELKAHLQNVLNGAQNAEAIRFIEGSAPSTPAATLWKLYFKSTGFYFMDDAGTEYTVGVGAPSQICFARLTLTSGTPVTAGDVTAATNIYMTPYKGNTIALYDGASAWNIYTFSEITISLAGQAADKNYDVFAYLSGGNVVTETVVWTNDTTRATALVLQNGVYVKSGTTTRRYIGTYRTTSTIGQCEDSVTKRYVWNYYHRVQRDMYLIEATDTWTYATATIRPWNNSTANRLSFVRGVNEDYVHVLFVALGSQAGGVSGQVLLGLDSTTANSGLTGQISTTTVSSALAAYVGKPGEGFHFIQALERAGGATMTFVGDNGDASHQSGLTGQLAA